MFRKKIEYIGFGITHSFRHHWGFGTYPLPIRGTTAPHFIARESGNYNRVGHSFIP